MARAGAVALILLLAAAAPAAEPPAGALPAPRDRAGRQDGERRLDEVRITGTPESPDVLFFLPRARFRLLPARPDKDWKERLLADSPSLESDPR